MKTFNKYNNFIFLKSELNELKSEVKNLVDKISFFEEKMFFLQLKVPIKKINIKKYFILWKNKTKIKKEMNIFKKLVKEDKKKWTKVKSKKKRKEKKKRKKRKEKKLIS